MYGTNDAPFAAGAALFRSGLARCETVAFTGVGHHPLVEEHDHAIRLIIDSVTAPG
jgi:hypothetical protein